MDPNSSVWLAAGVVVTLAFFVLIGYVVKVLRARRSLPVVIVAVGGLVTAFPAVLYAPYNVLQHTLGAGA
ncbi:hypothetical protein [Streptomyces sp. NPDC053048]|uniref:hypothetical protein n=1 Tax=Streptomyces sp. NPDC053048 TaxID=3365694 RepID=UPI0037D3A6E5